MGAVVGINDRYFVYEQLTGKVLLEGRVIGVGYSGHAEGKNNPLMQDKPDIGPIPRGWYTMGALFYSSSHGPDVIRLTPDGSNEMFGRSGFLIHGDKIGAPGEASLGCIIQQRIVRRAIADSGVKRLQVIEG